MKNQHKILAVIIISFVVTIVIIGLVVYLFISKNIREDFYHKLDMNVEVLKKLQFDNLDTGESSYVQGIRNNLADKLVYEKEYIIPLTREAGNLMTDSLQLPATFVKEALTHNTVRHKENSRYYVSSLHSYDKGGHLIIVSAVNEAEREIQSYLKKTSITALFLAIVMVTALSYYFSKNIFKPISRITEKVKQIRSENLHLRLENDHRSPELSELATTFNDMLNRIETTFEAQNNFISNASHELRTPLTVIIGEAEVCLSKNRSSQEYVETIKIILEESEVLESKTKALLLLAQTGFNGKSQSFKKIRIDQLLWDVNQTIAKINKDSKVFLDTGLLPENPEKLKVHANEQLLHLALTNVISNACKYSNNQVVNISIGASDKSVFIIVNDNGIGIPDGELKYIYDPFFRASNTNKFEGYGIGLPLTQNIIKMHQGVITVNSVEHQGTTVQIRLPIYTGKA